MNPVATGQHKQRSYSGDYMRRGKQAEQVVMDWLKTHPRVKTVTDVRHLSDWQEVDVDALAELHIGPTMKVEIKSDSHIAVGANVLFEVLRINHTASHDHAGKLGWSARTEADWLIFYSPKAHTLFSCTVADYRKSFQAYTQKCRKATRLSYVETDAVKSTVNVLIPWQYCSEIFNVYEL